MSWASQFPNELLHRPTGLVVLTGLDTVYNAVHKAIWDAFCNNRRPDRVPLQFKVLGVDHEYPKCKTKRASYEWYVPKGILKTGWMKKHLEQVPSVVVVFFDLDWVETMWKERQMECATKVQIVRDSLAGRNNRVCVVLIQKNTPLPPGEDVMAAERAASLCSACELSSKSLFVLPLTDHLLGYTIRLENAFYELTQSYYHTEARRVKAHKEFLNKTTHQLLFVRHQFKIAFFNELKQDTHTALKHYRQAYTHLQELRMHDTNLLEVKTIAGYINYKICRLSFQHNAPLDAISHFRKHTDFFKHRVGHAELAFEHSAWMSKQFHVFGELFDEAIKLGLTAIQTQHPGFYYQQAAAHTATRKELALSLPRGEASKAPDPLEALNSLDYYGQRPWRQGHQSIDPPDALLERDGINALQQLELSVDHSWIIIPLLNSAVGQFKKYKSPRMKRYLMVQMGTETFHAREYQKALQLLSRVTWEYRQEHWWPLLSSILNIALKCCYLTANVQEYVSTSMELMSKYIVSSSEEEKTRIQMNLIRVMSNDIPEPEPDCRAEDVANAHDLWQKVTAQTTSITVQMNSITPFVECKACFTRDSYSTDTVVTLKVFLRTTCPFPIRFSKLAVLFTNQTYNSLCTLKDGGGIDKETDSSAPSGSSANLYLVPGHTQMHVFTLVPQEADIGNKLCVSGVVLELGSEVGCRAVLHWSRGGGDAVPLSVLQQIKRSQNSPAHAENITTATPWSSIPVIHETSVKSREANVELMLKHDPPCLLHENYPLTVLVKNKEMSVISNIKLSVSVKSSQNVVMEQTTHISEDVTEQVREVSCHIEDVCLPELSPEHLVTKQLYVRCMEPGTRSLNVELSYEIDFEVRGQRLHCTCRKTETVELPCVKPFATETKVTSLLFEAIDTVYTDEAFILQAETSCVSPWPLVIEDTVLQLSSHAKFTDKDVSSKLAGKVVQNHEKLNECVSLVVPPTLESLVPLGTYTVRWKRNIENGIDVPSVTTVAPLPQTNVEQVPMMLELVLPSCGYIRQVLSITYILHNQTPYSQEVEFSMETNDNFMFAGHKLVHFRVLPNSSFRLSYNLVPLVVGNLLLPTVHVSLPRFPKIMDAIIKRTLPTHVFVLPSGGEKIVDVMAKTQPESVPAQG